MTTATLVPSLADAPPAEPRRPRVLFVASAFAAGASALVVVALLSVYLQIRGDLVSSGSALFPEGTVIPLTPGNMGLATLAMSVVTMAWVVHALRNDDRPHAYLALFLTLLFGVAFINTTVYLYQQLALGFDASGPAALLYIVTGAQLVMQIVAMLFVAVMGFQALGGELTGRDAEGMSAAALYWYVTFAVYVVVWYAIYITK
jgi:heme/copper-type cytochrome/quinol oxidase subunit 3